MKKLLLAAALLIPSIACAGTKLAVTGHCGQHEFDTVIELQEGQDYIEYTHENGIVLRAKVTENKDGTVTIEGTITDKNGTVAHPAITTEFGKPAKLVLKHDNSDRDVEVTIVATQD